MFYANRNYNFKSLNLRSIGVILYPLHQTYFALYRPLRMSMNFKFYKSLRNWSRNFSLRKNASDEYYPEPLCKDYSLYSISIFLRFDEICISKYYQSVISLDSLYLELKLLLDCHLGNKYSSKWSDIPWDNNSIIILSIFCEYIWGTSTKNK